jgi:superfamily II DNA or RNA helicase
MTPEQGQLVRVRNRLFTVQDVAPHVTDEGQAITRVALECLDDDRMGEEFSVIWEREVNTRVLHADAFPTPSGRWDHPDMFDAFLTALRWTSSSVLSSAGLQAPFRGAIEIEPYQLEPAARAVMMPRVNLLIADDVGLGKTIEAGLVLQELIARARVRSCLIACPASLQRQWADEMLDKFNLRFDIVDRDAVLRLRREYGTHVNPWRSFPRLITSVDYLKRNQQIGQFLAPDEHGNAAQWDLLILDEAHNCAPSGRASYIQDSDRTRMLRQIAPHFRHRLFLTATPHNGFTESFTALLEQLDPLRFHRDAVVNPDQVQNVMIRRLKEELSASGETRRRFAKRLVRAITVPEVPEEQRAADLLEAYIASRVERAKTAREQLPVRFALNVLKKRFLSCPTAFHHSLENHLDHVTRPHQQTDHSSTGDPLLVKRLIQQSLLDTDDDVRRDQLEQDALRESTRFFGRLEGDEETWLDELWAWSERACRQADAKLLALREWVETHLGTPSSPTTERLILFTEYRDTVEYLSTHMGDWLGADALLTLTGSTPLAEREEIKAAFQAPPGDHPVRVLIATDAAAEGLNLQNHCRFLIHYEIPWNPNRLEQRNGRIDRHGQTAKEVMVHHFLHANRADSRFLQAVVDKVETMRHDLGSVADVLEKKVEEYMLGRRSITVGGVSPRRTLHDDVRREQVDRALLRRLREQVEASRREWRLDGETIHGVLDAALHLEGHPGLEAVDGDLAGRGALLRQPPQAWGMRSAQSVKDARGRLLTLVFDAEHAADRSDVALVHLDHPLMRRALATFRRNLFALGLDPSERLARVTYRAVPDRYATAPILVVDARLLATAEHGGKLHESLESLHFTLHEHGVLPADTSQLGLLPDDLPHPAIPSALGEQLALALKRHEPELRDRLGDLAERRRAEVETALADRSRREQAEVREMITVRMAEIRARLKTLERPDYGQMRLAFDTAEREQFDEDARRLHRRLDDLEHERESEPRAIARRYRLRRLRVFPVGVRFLLPETVIARGRL